MSLHVKNGHKWQSKWSLPNGSTAWSLNGSITGIYLRLSHTLYPMKYVHVVNVICCYISYLSVLSGFMITHILQGHYTGNSSSTSVEILNDIGKIRQKLKTSKFNDTLVKYNNIPLGKFILKCFSFVLASVSKDENKFENEWHMVPLRDNSNCCVTQTLW